MIKLTESDSQGNWMLKGIPWEYINAVDKDGRIYGALCKLHDYEESLLSPEEVIQLIPPCKVGDTVYMPDYDSVEEEPYYIIEWVVAGVVRYADGWYVYDDADTIDLCKVGGDYAYLTRQEAERRLEEMKNE